MVANLDNSPAKQAFIFGDRKSNLSTHFPTQHFRHSAQIGTFKTNGNLEPNDLDLLQLFF